MKKIYNENPKVSSALASLELHQNPRPLIIGERLNSQGSKKAKKMVLDNDFDGLIELARYQVEDGAHCLDVCVATTERSDEEDLMQKIVKRLSLEIEAPLVIDSTDSKVIATALKQIPGVPIINSINLEGDGSRFSDITPLMKKYGAPAITMCIGPNGMAKTSKEKLEVAGILYDKAIGLGLKPWQLIFDVLTFTLATGEEEYVASAFHTLEGIEFVKEKYPKSLTTLGLSNVSFGLSPLARKYLNSVFLYHAIKSGLDTVIINPKDIIPYPQINSKEKGICEDLIFNNNNNALSELISYFSSSGAVRGTGTGTGTGATVIQKQTNLMEMDASWDSGKKCYFRIVNRLKDGIENDVVLAISERISSKDGFSISEKTLENGIMRKTLDGNKEKLHDAAVETLNEVLLPAMKEVGDKFGAGELILPFVLKSAECMKAAVLELEKYLIKQEGISKGKIVLCTVYGDVHDIGKNLVKTILVNNGYEVFDLGKQVPIPSIVTKIKEVNADAVGLSALLVSTSKQMQLFSEFLRENKIDIPVLCGGAAINSDYINRIAKGDGSNIYKAGIFYCKTAFDGLKVMNNLMTGNKEEYMDKWLEKLTSWKERKYNEATDLQNLSDIVSSVKAVKEKPIPPNFNLVTRLGNTDLLLDEIWQYLNKKSLFVLSWGLRGKKATELKDEYEELLKEWKVKVVKEKLFDPSAVYSYFRCRKVGGNSLLVKYQDGNKIDSEVIFEFPRSSNSLHLCLADYFDSEADDVVAFQSVTMGNKVAQIIDEWNKQSRYTDAYYLHGLAVETTEALADWINYKIKQELLLKDGGLRYSWGYPSCPDITQHFLVWKLLNPLISGMNLTESGQIDPEFSTAAIVVHHPEAQYFTL